MSASAVAPASRIIFPRVIPFLLPILHKTHVEAPGDRTSTLQARSISTGDALRAAAVDVQCAGADELRIEVRPAPLLDWGPVQAAPSLIRESIVPPSFQIVPDDVDPQVGA